MICKQCVERLQEIDRLKEEIERLKGKINQIERKEKKGFFGSSTPSSQIPIKPNSQDKEQKKQGGAKVRHKGHGRKPITQDTADEIIDIHIDDKCPDCGSDLVSKGTEDRAVIDGEPYKAKKVVYQCDKKWCPHCRKTFKAKPPVLPKCLYGNQLIANILEMHYLHCIPMGRIEAMLGIINSGAIFALIHRLAQLFNKIYLNLILEFRNSRVRGADETTWRNNGQSGYAWLFRTSDISLFFFRKTRSNIIVKEAMGVEKLPGFLVVDRYAGYNVAPCFLQYCYEHLKRHVVDIDEEFTGNKEVQKFSENMIFWLSQAMRLQGMGLTDEEYYKMAKEIKNNILSLAHSPPNHLSIKYIQNIFIDNAEKLYHWVDDREVPCHNNGSERELRPLVVARNVSFGSQSDNGLKTREIMMSVIHSANKRLKDINQNQFLKLTLDNISRNPDVDLASIFPASN